MPDDVLEAPATPAAPAIPETPAAPATPTAGDPAAPAAPAAIDYSSVILPKDSTLDPAVLERTVAIARERGLSTEQAQAALDLVHQEVGASRAALLESYQPGGAEWTKQVDGWKKETLADETLGKTPAERTAAIAHGGTLLKKFAEANPEMGAAMTAFLDTSGLGDKREVAHFFAWLGKAAGERPIAIGDPPVKKKGAAQLMYPDMAE